MGAFSARTITLSPWARRLLIFLGAAFAFHCGFNCSYNHFYVFGPYIQDAGWHSGVIFHRGWNPQNVPLEHPGQKSFYSFHLSPFVALLGILSPAFPGDRAMYYCLVQGLVYAPLGAAVAYLLPERARIADAVLAMVATVAIVLSGQTLACLGYPHFEPFVPATIAVMLAAVVRGKSKMAFAALAACACLREDAGVHAASFAFAALACNVTKRPFPLSTKRLIQLTGFGFACSIVLVVVQKKFFPGADLFRGEYLGEPTFAHVTGAEMRRRLGEFSELCRFIYVPLLATFVIAIVRRDPRYLFGWIVELPWLLINFIAAQPSKARFELYTGFPFIASAFWVVIYSHIDVARAKEGTGFLALRRWAPFIVMSALGTWLSFRNGPWMGGVIQSALFRAPVDRRAVEQFANRLRANPNPSGRTRVDNPVAAWTLESVDYSQLMEERAPKRLDGDNEFYFFRYGFESGYYTSWLAAAPELSNCGSLVDTQIRWCGRGPLPEGFAKSSPLLERSRTEWFVQFVPGALLIPKSGSGAAPNVAIATPFDYFPPGDYRAIWTYEAKDCTAETEAVFDVVHARQLRGQAHASPRASSASATFHVAKGELHDWEARAWTSACDVTVSDLRIVADIPSAIPSIAYASVAATEDPAALTQFAERLNAQRSVLENKPRALQIDQALAALPALSTAPALEEKKPWAALGVGPLSTDDGLRDATTIYFLRDGYDSSRRLDWLAHAPQLPRCGALPRTPVRWCGRGALPDGFEDASPALERMMFDSDAHREGGRIVFAPSGAPGASRVAATGPFASFAPGDYRVTWTFNAKECTPSAEGKFDVARDGASVEEVHPVASAGSASLPFHVNDDTRDSWEFRAWTWPCASSLDAIRVEADHEGVIAPAHP